MPLNLRKNLSSLRKHKNDSVVLGVYKNSFYKSRNDHSIFNPNSKKSDGKVLKLKQQLPQSNFKLGFSKPEYFVSSQNHKETTLPHIIESQKQAIRTAVRNRKMQSHQSFSVSYFKIFIRIGKLS